MALYFELFTFFIFCRLITTTSLISSFSETPMYFRASQHSPKPPLPMILPLQQRKVISPSRCLIIWTKSPFSGLQYINRSFILDRPLNTFNYQIFQMTRWSSSVCLQYRLLQCFVNERLCWSSIVNVSRAFILRLILYISILGFMPSGIYESVKQSVIEFQEIKKKNQKVEDKLIFRWKLVTLGLSIVFIVLLGVFSQLIRSLTDLPDVTVEKSYIIPLLQNVADVSVPTVTEASHLITGITASADAQGINFQWNRAQLLFSTKSNPNLQLLQTAINGQGKLVFVVSTDEVPSLSKFAFFAHQPYNQNSLAIEDDSSTKYSTFFNLVSGETLHYKQPGCPLYETTTNVLNLFGSLKINSAAGTVTIGVQPGNESCFSLDNDKTNAYAKLGKLTSIDLTGDAPVTITLGALQVFKLYLDEEG